MENYGSYQLLKRLATGGMAQIFLAREQRKGSGDNLLVVKRILPHLAENEEFVRMFLDEARIAARLNHPNIVQIFDLGALDDSYFIAMEYIHGEDVRRVWKRADSQGKPFPPELVCRVISEACSGLDYAHKKSDLNGKPLGIVHRDISPQNILITFDGDVKVVDFGIAKAADQATVTKSGVLKGKYSYMSPEQAAGKRLDARSDIFALGVVLYELLTGTRLFKRSNEIQTLNAVTACKVNPPSEVNAHLPRTLDAIVLKALSKSPDDRFQDALALHDALEKWMSSANMRAMHTDLSRFMHDIYAERLAKEGEHGGILGAIDAAKEDSPKKRNGRIVNGRGKLPRPSGNVAVALPVERQGTVPVPQDRRTAKALEGILSRVGNETHEPAPTVIGDPEISLRPENSWQTRPLSPGSKKRSLWAKRLLRTLALLLVCAAGIFVQRRWGSPTHWRIFPPAVVHVTSEPAGATVIFAGQTLSKMTPMVLPPTPPGKQALILRKTGFRDANVDIDIPKTGNLDVPQVILEPLPPPVPKVKVVTFTLRSDPANADVAVDGQPKGKTPLAMDMPTGSDFSVDVTAPGYKGLKRAIHLTDEDFQADWVTLEKNEKVKPVKAPPAPKTPVGTVRFAVTPWADVTCGRFHFGTTPFADKQLPPGVYDCVFRNPDLGAKSERVEVRVNETRKVTVRF